MARPTLHRRKFRNALLAPAAIALLWLAAGAAQAQQNPAHLVLQGVTIIDVQKGRLLTDSTVLIRVNRIEQVAPAAQIQIPAGAQVINAGGKFILPGLWDTDFTFRPYPFTPGLLVRLRTGLAKQLLREELMRQDS